MKKVLIVLLVLSFAGTGLAAEFALDKGSIGLAGSVFFASSSGDKYGSSSMTTISLSPSVSYFLIKGLSLDARLSFLSQSQGSISVDAMSAGLALTYYIGAEKGKKFVPYVGAGVLFGSTASDASTLDIPIALGAIAFLSDSVGLNMTVSYTLENYTPNGASTSVSGGTLMVSIGVSAFIF